MIPLLILSPFAVAAFAAWLGARHPRHVRMLALWPAGLAVIFAWTLRTVVAIDGPQVVSLTWAPSLGLSLSFNLDGLGLLFALLITGIGALVVAYASAYLEGHPHLGRFMATLFAFMGAMLGVVLADNLFLLFVFWELTGFTSFLLIGFEHERREVRAAAVQALLVTGAGGIALFAGAALLQQAAGTWSLSAIATGGMTLADHPLYVAIVVLVMLAAFTKSAQFPFHFWLPGAMAAPTPVSAYLHSATMVKAGVYLLARMTPILGGTPLWSTVLLVVGGVTMAGAAWRAVQETDLKRVLAYSTISSLGALVLMIGIGTPGALLAAVVYLVAHACYKGTLFMVAGIIDHETGTRDVTVLSGLGRLMPKTAAASVLAAGSMIGLPVFFGFFGKELFYDAEWHYESWPGPLLAVTVAANALTGMAGLIAGYGPFSGPRPDRFDRVHEPSWLMWMGPMVLASAGVVFSLAPSLVSGTIALAVASATGVYVPVTLALWHGVTPVLLLSGVTLALALLLYSQRGLLRGRMWPRALGTERLYTGLVGALDLLSRVSAPPLQSASIRSYVLVLLLATVTAVGTALFMGGGGWTIARTTDIRPHELMVALIICGGAVAAARAKSSMNSVIALGVVGYGVALMFVFFGAPDLAMTQFSVETLTVVIFVLVFRHFSDFGSLTTRLVRWRDALVAAAFGAIVSTLVLLVGANGKSSRLSEYFVEAGPTLAHGRNIVNVILVDFRAFDTLGEITVLVVAAIGVHAVLRITSDDRRRP